eukprot:Awhi_evm1s12583
MSPDFEENYLCFKDTGVPYDDCAICDFDKAYCAHLYKDSKENENTTFCLKPELKKKRK